MLRIVQSPGLPTTKKDSSLLAFAASKLGEAHDVLDNLVDDYSDFRRLKRLKSEYKDDSTTQLKLSDILSYARQVSYTTFAPPEFGAGQAPLRGALPPSPQEEQMRASQLYKFADIDVGLTKTGDCKNKRINPLFEPLLEVPASMPGMPYLLPPKPIQVRHVPLDIACDTSDDSSDYSSDSESSSGSED